MFSPEVTYLRTVVKTVVRRRGLGHNSIDCSVDARSLNAVSMDTIMMTYQVAVTDERPSAEIALVVLTCRTVNSNVNGELTLAGERHRAAITT